MEVKATAKYIKISAKKARLITNLVKGMDVGEAMDYLRFVPRKASSYVIKVLKSALANAEHNFNLKKDNLFIKRISADEGPVLKRWQPRAFGRATPIRKKSSHLVVILAEKVPGKAKRLAKKTKAPVSEAPFKEEKKPAKVEVQEEMPRAAEREISEPKGREIFDARRKAGRRTKQHLDKLGLRKAGGALKRVFRRKAV